jgi:hypothetical protein
MPDTFAEVLSLLRRVDAWPDQFADLERRHDGLALDEAYDEEREALYEQAIDLLFEAADILRRMPT